jgi:hypothetical protein
LKDGALVGLGEKRRNKGVAAELSRRLFPPPPPPLPLLTLSGML